jgi:hypothetical protein
LPNSPTKNLQTILAAQIESAPHKNPENKKDNL